MTETQCAATWDGDPSTRCLLIPHDPKVDHLTYLDVDDTGEVRWKNE